MNELTLEIRFISNLNLNEMLHLIGCVCINEDEYLYRYNGKDYKLMTPDYLLTFKISSGAYELKFIEISLS